MRFSDQTDKLIPALASIQNRVEVKKNKTNPHHKNKYADLEAIVDAISPELDGQGLMFIQTLDDENLAPGQVLIITRIVHVASGQWLESRFRMDARAATPQDLGSAVTYARRYSLVTILGLTPEDDDGNKASGHKPSSRPSAAQKVAPAVSTGAPSIASLKTEISKLVRGKEPEAVRQALGFSWTSATDPHQLANAIEILKAG